MRSAWRIRAAAAIGLAATAALAAALVPAPSDAEPNAVTVAAPDPVGLAPAADTYVSSGRPDNNYGTARALRVARSKRALMRFDLRAVTHPVERARLRLPVTSASQDASIVVAATSGGWAETSVTWRTAPPPGASLGSTGHVESETFVVVDVTEAVTAGTAVDFALLGEAGRVTIASRESSTPARLLVTFGAGTATEATLLAAGDIATCRYRGDNATARQLDGLTGTVAALGDTVYPDGSRTDYRRCYEPTWGRHIARTRPATGNHEYRTPGAAGYFEYFGDAAGPPGKGWYSYDLGTWHIVVLNSNCGDIGGCSAQSEQGQWLKADLAAHPGPCTLAYFHHPRWSSGKHGGDERMTAFWRILSNAGVDVVLAGHDHHYERFAPIDDDGAEDPGGIRSFVVGSGGASHAEAGPAAPGSEFIDDRNFGVLRMRLQAGRYTWEFLRTSGGAADPGAGVCV